MLIAHIDFNYIAGPVTSGRPNRLVFLEDLFESLKEQNFLDVENIEQVNYMTVHLYLPR